MKSPHNKLLGQLTAIAAADLAVFGLFNTRTASVMVLFLGFLLLSANIYVLVKLALKLISLYGIKTRNNKRLSLTITGVIIFILALQSVGQINLRDIVVISVVASLIYLYTSLVRRPRQSLESKRA